MGVRCSNLVQDDDSHIVWRTDLGVVFRPVTRVNNANSAWLHVYQIPRLKLPKLAAPPDICQFLEQVIHLWDIGNDAATTDRPSHTHMPIGSYDPLDRGPDKRIKRVVTANKRRGGKPRSNKRTEMNYLAQVCRRYQNVVNDVWDQISTVAEGIRVNSKASDVLLEERSLYFQSQADQDEINYQAPPYHSDRNRTRRGLFDWVADGARFLFGFATRKDLTKFAGVLAKLSARNEDLSRDIELMTDSLQSYSLEVNEKYQKLRKVIGRLQDEQAILASHMAKIKYEVDQRIARTELAINVHSMIVSEVVDLSLRRLAAYQAYYAIVRERMSAIEDLVTRNVLSPLLVPPSEIKALFLSIRRTLQKNFPKFQLAIKDVGHVFRTPGISYTWNDDFLYIQVRIPVAAYDSRYLVYRPVPLAIPIASGMTSTLTKLTALPELLAVNYDQSFYFELSQADLDSCVGITDRYCLQAFPVAGRQNPSCLAAVFWNQYAQAKESCEVHYIEARTPIRILQSINEHSFLSVAQSQDEWFLTCHREGPKKIQPVTMGVFQLPCACSLRTPHHFLPSTIDNCNASSRSMLNTERIDNVLYALQWIDMPDTKYEIELSNLTMLLQNPPLLNISHPDWGEDYILPSSDLVLNLKDVVKQAQSQRKLQYRVIGDLLESVETHDKHKTNTSITIFVVIGVIISIIITIALIAKRVISNETAVFTTLANLITGTEAFDIKTDQLDNNTQLNIVMPSVMMGLLIAVLFLFLVYKSVLLSLLIYQRIYKYVKGHRYIIRASRGELNQIILELQDDKETIYLPVAEVNQLPGSLFAINPKIAVIYDTQSPCCRPHILINWFHTIIESNTDNSRIPLPNVIGVPWLVAKSVRRLLASRSLELGLLAGLQGKFTYIPISNVGQPTLRPHLVEKIAPSPFTPILSTLLPRRVIQNFSLEDISCPDSSEIETDNVNENLV
jgi:hypothetical protein